MEALRTAYLLDEQADDLLNQKKLSAINTNPIIYFGYDKNGVLVPCITKNYQFFVPEAMKSLVLNLALTPKNFGYPGERQMYAFMRHQFY